MDAKLLKKLIQEALLIIEKKQFSEKEVSITTKENKVIFKFKKAKIIISEINKLEVIEASDLDFYDLMRMTQIIDRAFADYKTLALRRGEK